MAVQAKLCFALLLVFHFTVVSCRHDYYKHHSQYVKGESSTESGPSSTAGISTSAPAHLSTPEFLISENVIPHKENRYSSSDNDTYDQGSRVTVIQSYTGYYDNGPNPDSVRNIVLISYGVTMGGVIFFGLIVGCIVLCCPCCRRGKERRGFIISTNVPNQQTSNFIQPQIPQAIAVQHVPPGIHAPQHPPAYDTQPIHQQYQYPSTEHLLQNPMQPMGQQQATMLQDPNAETTPPPYPTKY